VITTFSNCFKKIPMTWHVVSAIGTTHDDPTTYPKTQLWLCWPEGHLQSIYGFINNLY
jgi:hypothetical protein